MKGYTYTRSKVIEIESSKDEKKAIYNLTMSKGNDYVFLACTGEDQEANLVIELLDRHDQKLLTNYFPRTGLYYDKFTFKCKTSGPYNLRFKYLSKNGKGCGICAMGFRVTTSDDEE